MSLQSSELDTKHAFTMGISLAEHLRLEGWTRHDQHVL